MRYFVGGLNNCKEVGGMIGWNFGGLMQLQLQSRNFYWKSAVAAVGTSWNRSKTSSSIAFRYQPRFLGSAGGAGAGAHLPNLQQLTYSTTMTKSDAKSSPSQQQSATAHPKNSKLVIFHMVPRGRTLPNPSPFATKLWTYLNMANIPYKIDTKAPFGTNGKTPWIELDGDKIPDSQVCIEYLGKKFDINLGKVYTAEQLAVSRALRIMLEDHFYWGAVTHWRLNEGAKDALKVYKLSGAIPHFWFKYIFFRRMRAACNAQGLGRHSTQQIHQFMFEDLRAASKILGNKKFILGDTPCEDDCGIFGQLSQVVWGLPNSPYEHLLNNELTNLRDYCERIKKIYWQNWDKELAR